MRDRNQKVNHVELFTSNPGEVEGRPSLSTESLQRAHLGTRQVPGQTRAPCTPVPPPVAVSLLPTWFVPGLSLKDASYYRAPTTCQTWGWRCLQTPGPAFLKAAENFTLLVKNNIWYPKFNFTKRNILPNITTTYLKSCIYNAATDPFCPIFRLGKIVENAGHSFQDMAVEGGIMGIQIKWDCNLDRAASFCLPRYSFRRLDTRDLDHNVSPGYNFRFAKYYNDLTGTEHRTLIKAYGIRFDIIVFGKAGKFDIIPTMINIGSGLALFGVATVLCDVIVLYCMKKRYYYREKKYKYVEEYEQGINNEMDQ
ncbi:P2X purinoceptor 4 [Myotis brandtii]|uniref:p2X purinoceptor 4 n=1 Tax=Myotis brandtii TaxID=109478 RepID=S7N8Q9_MYOBR|nr:P2X purinoceptor 4 [Myotis brandtii]